MLFPALAALSQLVSPQHPAGDLPLVQPDPDAPREDRALFGSSPYVDGRVIVRFGESVDVVEAVGALAPERYVFVEPLMPQLGLYLFEIVDGAPVRDAIAELGEHALVRAALPDHVLERANIPNDADFGQLFNMLNTGQGGGTIGIDVRATEAWDITTGSSDHAIAIVDWGCQDDHPDLIANRWTNTAEQFGIPNFDDDGNGFPDDVHGWDGFGNDPDVPDDFHGTHVAGIAGAKGNNGIGVAGMSWNSPLIHVAGAGLTSNTIKAYNYVIGTKNVWLSSGGTLGANIVVQNSSFVLHQIDCSLPAFSVWDDMFDLMGQAGILSVVASPNQPVDVDVDAGLPASCSSDWMIAVTNMDKFGNKNPNAAWGDEMVDLAAPGTGVYSTDVGSSYLFLGGTSMATPHVSGTVALLYDAGSSDFQALAAANPAAASLVARDAILSTVAFNANFATTTSSGGMLDARAAIDWIVGYGAPGLPPGGNIGISSVTPSNVPAVVVDGVAKVTLLGSGFFGTTKVTVDGIELSNFPAQFSALSDTEMVVDIPLVSRLGWVDIVVEDGSNSATAQVFVTQNIPPVLEILNSDPAFLFSALGLTVRMGASPATVYILWVSRDLLPTIVPGVLDLDIGNNFSNLFLITGPFMPDTGYVEVNYPFNLAPGTTLYWQGSVFDGAFPMSKTNVQKTIVLF